MLALLKAALPSSPVPVFWVMLMPDQSLVTTPQVVDANTLGHVVMPTGSRKVVKILAALAPVISVALMLPPLTVRVPLKNLTTEPWATVIAAPEPRVTPPVAR